MRPIPWCMTNSLWVTLLHSCARHAHQSCCIPWPTASERHCFICLPGILSSIMLHPMANSKWVTLLHFFARHSHQSCLIPWPTGSKCYSFNLFARNSHQSCLIPWPTGSEWYCFICLAGSLINHVGSHDQQFVSDTASFVCHASSSIMLHPWPTACKWHCLICCQAGLSIMLHPITNSL